jgi:hypothetical protein
MTVAYAFASAPHIASCSPSLYTCLFLLLFYLFVFLAQLHARVSFRCGPLEGDGLQISFILVVIQCFSFKLLALMLQADVAYYYL